MMWRKEVMTTKIMRLESARVRLAWRLAPAVLLLLVLCHARQSSAQESQPKTFSSPGEACSALFAAVQKGDDQALESILGAGKELSSSNDDVEDRVERERFRQKYQEMHRLVREPDGSTVLYVGAENWPFPVPLASSDQGWYFDSRAGMREILFRAVGENEITAIRICDAFVIEKKQDKTGATGDDPISQYAQELLTDGSKNADNNVRSSHPFHGYYFRVVRGNSAAGMDSHDSGGKNTVGLVLVASPAEYRASGVTTFIVTQDGVIHQKDLGPNTEKLVPTIEKRNHLDSTWQVTE
jgi:hypothetical protein